MTLGPWIGGLLADGMGYRISFMAGAAFFWWEARLSWPAARERFSRPQETVLQKTGGLGSLLRSSGFPAMLALFFFSTAPFILSCPSCRFLSKRCANPVVRT